MTDDPITNITISFLIQGFVLGIVFSYTCACVVGYYQECKLKKMQGQSCNP